jgi:hypothetical protein
MATERAPPPSIPRKLALGALATGAVAGGALALGAVAVGALAIGRLAVRKGTIRSLHIEELTVDRLQIREQRQAPRSGEADALPPIRPYAPPMAERPLERTEAPRS